MLPLFHDMIYIPLLYMSQNMTCISVQRQKKFLMSLYVLLYFIWHLYAHRELSCYLRLQFWNMSYSVLDVFMA